MIQEIGFLPFINDVKTTNALLAVITMVNNYLDPADSIKYASIEYKVNIEDLIYYFNIIEQDGWIPV